jgi:hypothetical protein
MLVTRRDMIYDIKPQILTPARKMLPLVFIFLGWVAPATLSPWDSLTANIAVVEYRPLHDSSALNNNTVALNTKKYVEILKSASPKVQFTPSCSFTSAMSFPETRLDRVS